MGLDGLLRARAARCHGILNGIDDEVWNPATDAAIAATYDRHDASTTRARNKAALQTRFGLRAEPDAPLFGVDQPAVVAEGSRPAARGAAGAARRRRAACAARRRRSGAGGGFHRRAPQRYPGQVGCVIGYDEQLAHLIQAGADALLVPSRFEPCGLTQLCALRYGAVPVVARVGGLADTVIDANEMAIAAGVATGVQFYPPVR